MALFDQKPRSASAVAAGRARILRLSKGAFDQLQGKNSVAGMSVLFAMIRTSSERIRRLSTQVVVYDEVGKAIGESRDLQTLLDVILQQLSTATAADWGFLLLRSQFSESFELRGDKPDPDSPTRSGRPWSGLPRTVLQNPGTNWWRADEQSVQILRVLARNRSLLLSLIRVEGQFLGLIVLGGKNATSST
jgi:hypothetical protein